MTSVQGRFYKRNWLLIVLLLAMPFVAKAERFIVVTRQNIGVGPVREWAQRNHLQTLRSHQFNSISPQTRVIPIISGIVVELNQEELVKDLEMLPGVEFVEKEIFYPSPKPIGKPLVAPTTLGNIQSEFFFPISSSLFTGPNTPYGITLVRAPEVWKMGFAGLGVRVMVLDTGIDRNHPALKVNYEKGRNLLGGNNQPYPEADSIGHGTHVAGTIAATQLPDGFVGVAPQARILAGRVCGDNGCSSIAVVEGLQWAVQERVDVVNMSFGGPIASRSERMAVEAAENAGVVLVAASGNYGAGRVSFPAAFPSVIAVGAVNAKEEKASFSNWGPELDIMAPGVGVLSTVPQGMGKEVHLSLTIGGNTTRVEATTFNGSQDSPQGVEATLVHAGLGRTDDFQNVSVRDRIALIARGQIPFGEKARNALNAGARAVIIYNNEPGLLQGTLTNDGSIIPIPAAAITQELGEQLVHRLAANESILARIQTVRTDYDRYDGTSMASPHVAGVVALLRSIRKNVSPAMIRDILRNTARPIEPSQNNQTGAGIVDAEAAARRISAL